MELLHATGIALLETDGYSLVAMTPAVAGGSLRAMSRGWGVRSTQESEG